MSIQTINIGNVVNDGLGDDLRTAFQKVNSNFTALNSELAVTGLNIGTTGVGLFKQKNGSNLEFKNIVAGRKVSLDDTLTSVVINNDADAALTRIETNSGYVQATDGNNGRITLQGGDDVDVTSLGTVITVNTILPVTKIMTTFDFGPIGSSFQYTEHLALAFTNIDFGTITNPSSVSLDLGSIQ